METFARNKDPNEKKHACMYLHVFMYACVPLILSYKNNNNHFDKNDINIIAIFLMNKNI